jgi:hypothetical protein
MTSDCRKTTRPPTMTSTRYPEALPRLSIPPPLNLQQPLVFDGRQSMFSPALPTTLQNSFHPSFPMNNLAMQTPLQPFFAPQPPIAPGRPAHRAQPSLAHPAAAGIPQLVTPTTPVGQIHARHASLSVVGPQSFGQQFLPPPRNRRQPSIGGPPKAPLGGPARKLSPLPAPLTVSPAAPTSKGKKVTVNFPKETLLGPDESTVAHPTWARVPWDTSLISNDDYVDYPESTSAEQYPPDWRDYRVPPSIDVFLPGKVSL